MCDTCNWLINDDEHMFRRMWAADPWRLIAYGRKTCFETSRDRGGAFGEDPNMFFDKIVNGLICKENWFALAPPRLTPVAARCG